MPRAKRKAARTKVAYTRQEVFRLATGFCFEPDQFGRGDDAMAAMRRAWREDPALREMVQIVFDERQATGRVGSLTRPWAVTKFDIPGDGRRAESRPRSRKDAATGGTQRRARNRATIATETQNQGNYP